MTTNHSRRTVLSWWQRFLFGMLLPMLAYYGTCRLFQDRVFAFWQPYSMPVGGSSSIQVLGPYVPYLGVILTLPIWMFLLLFMLRRWRHWYTALVGGILAIALGLVATATAMLLINHLLG